MRVLVTGSSGMLGRHVVEAFQSGSRYEVFGIQRRASEASRLDPARCAVLDLSDGDALDRCLRKIDPEIVVHCAARVDVDACEQDPDYARRLHVDSTKRLAAFSRSVRLAYVSTDAVFDGASGNYSEQDVPGPLNHYARTKLEGESAALGNENSIVVRTNLFGTRSSSGRSLAEWALGRLQAGQPVPGWGDVHFNPLYTRQLALVLRELLERGFRGRIHAGSRPPVSKHSFLVQLAEAFGYDPALVQETSAAQAALKARRPGNTTLNTGLLEKTLGRVPDLREGIGLLKRDLDSEPRT